MTSFEASLLHLLRPQACLHQRNGTFTWIFLELYKYIMEALKEIQESQDRDAAAKAVSFLSAIQHGDFWISLITTAAVVVKCDT